MKASELLDAWASEASPEETLGALWVGDQGVAAIIGAYLGFRAQ